MPKSSHLARNERSWRGAWARITKIHDILRAHKFPNCASLAREFEVSSRTIARDIQFMQDRLDLPIQYDNKRWGFFYSGPVDNLPKAPITEGEIFALLVARKALSQFSGTPFEKPLASAFQKLTAQLDSKDRLSLKNLADALSFRPVAAEKSAPGILDLIKKAIRDLRTLKFQYRNWGKRDILTRSVHPHHVACIDNHWYLFGYDAMRKDLRTFSLSRVSDITLLQDKFKKPKNFNLDAYLRGSLAVLKGSGDYEIVVELDTYGTDLVRGRKWHSSQQLVELANGSSQLRLRLSALDEIQRSILSWGSHATVIRPQELIARIKKTAEDLLHRYS